MSVLGMSRAGDLRLPLGRAPLRLNLESAERGAYEAGVLKFTLSSAGGVNGVGARPRAKGRPPEEGLSASRCVFLGQLIIVSMLLVLMFLLFYMTHRLDANITWYYEAASPYLAEFGNHSMGVMRHADVSAASLERVMRRTENMSASSLPAIARTVNRTADVVARMERVTQHPAIRLSLT